MAYEVIERFANFVGSDNECSILQYNKKRCVIVSVTRLAYLNRAY